MSGELSKFNQAYSRRIKKTSIGHENRIMLHKMSKEQLDAHYKKYFSEQGNVETCLRLNSEYEQLDKEELERYEKWLMESD